MLLEQCVLQLLFFVFIELILVTCIAVALFIALVIVIRRSDKRK